MLGSITKGGDPDSNRIIREDHDLAGIEPAPERATHHHAPPTRANSAVRNPRLEYKDNAIEASVLVRRGLVTTLPEVAELWFVIPSVQVGLTTDFDTRQNPRATTDSYLTT